MAAGRKPAPPARQLAVQINTEAIANAAKARDELAALDVEAEAKTHELAIKLGYDGPLEPDLLQHGIAHGMRRTVDTFLDMGRMLLLLKERVGHGDFQRRVEQVGLAPRAAQKFMQVALKFSNAPLTAHLKKAIGGQGKLLELLVLDDEEITELAEMGSTLGITLDEIDAMGQKELRAALREAREEAAAKDKLIDTKNKKIDKLQSFKPRPDALARTQEQEAQLEALYDATRGCELHFMKLAQVVETIQAGDAKPMIGRANQAVQYLIARMADLIAAHGIEVDMSEQIEAMPDWLMPGGGQA